MKNSVRFADEKDFDFIYESLKDDLKEQGVLHRFRYSEEEFRVLVFGNQPVSKFLILQMNDEEIGFAHYSIDYRNFTVNYLPTLYLTDLYVKPSHRKMGGGTALFNQLKEIAAKEQCGRIEWLVLASNKEALGFYEISLKGRIISHDLHYMRLEL